MVAASLANMPRGGVRDGQNTIASQTANLHTEVSQTQAAELLQVSPRSVAAAAKVKRTAPAEVIEAVKAGNISLNMAALYITKKPNNLTRYYFCSSFKQYCISIQP